MTFFFPNLLIIGNSSQTCQGYRGWHDQQRWESNSFSLHRDELWVWRPGRVLSLQPVPVRQSRSGWHVLFFQKNTKTGLKIALKRVDSNRGEIKHPLMSDAFRTTGFSPLLNDLYLNVTWKQQKLWKLYVK